MVHKKYIKKKGKIFGPYLYKNYRENGKTKTRYLGKAPEKKIKKGIKTVKKSVKKNKILFILLGVVLLLLLFVFSGLFYLEKSGFKGTLSELKGELPSETVDVFVTIFPNSPPEILNVDSEIYVCENTFLSYFFNTTDPDMVVDGYGSPVVTVDISNKNPFYITSNVLNNYIIESEIFSFNVLDKSHVEAKRNGNDAWAVYPETITASDGQFSDSVNTDIIVVEVNNPPVFDVGVQTLDVYTQGEDNNFYYDLGSILLADNEETPTQNLIFNLDFFSVVPFFSIDSLGVINFTGNNSYILPGQNFTTYHLNLSVRDTGLLSLRDNIHPSISLCYNYGLSDGPQIWSQDFYLTITKQNRAPEILSYSPLDLNFSFKGDEVLYFNVSAKDPDMSPLDISWYVDSIQEAHETKLYEENLSEFVYTFGCNVWGNHSVEVKVTDGLLNKSIQWNISVENAPCPISFSQPSGGGGGLYCKEKWACEDWKQCESLEQVIDVFLALDKDQELLIRERCELFNYSLDVCGFQTRDCLDANKCGTKYYGLGTIRECYFTENPTCVDGIQNCHGGFCEVLVDCGGPCEVCLTCSDGIQNQDEEKIDCGGPCKDCVELPFKETLFKYIISSFLILLLVVIIFLVYKQVKKYKGFKEIVKAIPKRKISEKTSIPKFVFVFIVVVLLFFANIFIMNFAQTGRFVLQPEDIGYLVSYGFINNFIRNLPILFISGPIINGNTRLEIWDDSDFEDRYSVCTDYCAQKAKPSSGLWTVYFYANYTDNTDYLPLSTGTCDIAFQDSQKVYGSPFSMNYNSGSGLFEYSRTFDYKGDYNFNINCSDGVLLVNGEDNLKITNTEPYILKTAAGYVDIDFDGQKEAWQCFEDDICYYDFSLNVSEDDINDVLIYDYTMNINTTLTDFKINSSTGLLEINITDSVNTGSEENAKTIELSVQDTERMISAVLEVDVHEINDAPVFVNLINKDLNSKESFLYAIQASDEEDNFPFIFDVDFVSCDAATLIARGNCSLFTSSDYVADELNGFLNINFIPQDLDFGTYFVNFSVMDNSSLGNELTSQIVNFTVQIPLWNYSLNYNYSLVEDQIHPSFPLDLNTKIINAIPPVIFYNETAFPSFDLTSNGIMDFIPTDIDVGHYSFNIYANDSLMRPSAKIFNFTIINVNDAPQISLVNAGGIISIDPKYNIVAFENSNVEIFLFIDDNDFLIPLNQKSFYDENLNVQLDLQGPNSSLFNFSFDSVNRNQAKYSALFTPRAADVGSYILDIIVTDNSGVSDVLSFNLTIIERSYDFPQILYPEALSEFNLFENISSNLRFRANHSVGDNLTYKFYVDGVLERALDYYGDATDLIWDFIPNFTQETYNQTSNLTLTVLNIFFDDLNTSRTWNLTINHTNAPVEFTNAIGDKQGISLDYSLIIDLKNHFLDEDYFDVYYNQSVEFDIVGDQGVILISGVAPDWTFALSSSAPITETFNITAYDINMSNTSMRLTSDVSNNFLVEFVPPTVVPTPTPTPVTRTKKVPLSLKIIMPGKISAYEGETIDIPLTLINSGRQSFRDLSLNSSAFKNLEIIKEIKTSLDKTYFKSLDPGKEENITLTVFFDTDKLGDYEILVNAESKSPSYKDWGKVHINLQAINESRTREIILFTEEFLTQNPQCLEIKEIMNEAQGYFDVGDYSNARIKTEEAMSACKEAVAQVTIPKLNLKDFKISIYLVLAIVIAFIVGLLYYFIKRRKFQKTISAPINKLNQGKPLKKV